MVSEIVAVIIAIVGTALMIANDIAEEKKSLPPSLSLLSGEKHNGNDDIGSNDSGKKKDEPGVEGVRKIVL